MGMLGGRCGNDDPLLLYHARRRRLNRQGEAAWLIGDGLVVSRQEGLKGLSDRLLPTAREGSRIFVPGAGAESLKRLDFQ